MTVRVRVRGIYATALTASLREVATVVGASEAIRRRFDEPFPDGPADVRIRDAPDRQGVAVTGAPEAVGTIRDRLDVARDTFDWSDPTPAGAVFDGRVRETLGSGAAVDLGEGEGFLPYRNASDYVETGDVVRVRVAEGRPPWSEDRAVLDADLRVVRGPVALVRAGPADGGDGVERADLLSPEPPPGWTVRWADGADETSLDALEAALAAAVERAAGVESALSAAPEPADRRPARLDGECAGAWVWFGRESRFALDDRRRTVAPTLPGHHRIKAGEERASTAVDFAEAVCGSYFAPGRGARNDSAAPPGDGADRSSGSATTSADSAGSPDEDGARGERAGDATSVGRTEFPFDAVVEQFGPAVGDRVAIDHGKPDGRLVVLGEGAVTDVDPAGRVTVRREMTPGGRYDGLGVERRAGDVAVTRFREGRWWYPTVYRSAEGALRGTYVNVCTPVEVFPRRVRYVDLHVDVVRRADGTVSRVDDDDLEAAVAAGHVSEPLAARARQVAAKVADAL